MKNPPPVKNPVGSGLILVDDHDARYVLPRESTIKQVGCTGVAFARCPVSLVILHVFRDGNFVCFEDSFIDFTQLQPFEHIEWSIRGVFGSRLLPFADQPS